jgi:hypothetical protein
MSETKHTPGPWKVGGISLNTGAIAINHPEYRLVIADVLNAASFGDFVTASIRGRRDFGSPATAKTQWANARLIAAAPCIYEALRELTAHVSKNPTGAIGWNAVLNKAEVALLKAEGRTDA